MDMIALANRNAPVNYNIRLEVEEHYAQYPLGTRFALKVLHAAHIETGTVEEHSDGSATIRVPLATTEGPLYRALGELVEYGIDVMSVAPVTSVSGGTITERVGEIKLRSGCPERANEQPGFVAAVAPVLS